MSASSAVPPTPGGLVLPSVEKNSGGGGGAVTVSIPSAVRFRVPSVAVTLNGCEPAGVAEVVPTVSVERAATGNTCGAKVLVTASRSSPDRERATSPVKPSAGVTCTVKAVVSPARTVAAAGLSDTAKSGCGGAGGGSDA